MRTRTHTFFACICSSVQAYINDYTVNILVYSQDLNLARVKIEEAKQELVRWTVVTVHTYIHTCKNNPVNLSDT